MIFEELGSTIRPFATAAGVQCRGCSRPLQRVIVDLAADVSFQMVPTKLEEHYGISVAIETIRVITLQHARNICENTEILDEVPDIAGAKQIIAETDGSMIPIVTTSDDPQEPDRRKTRKTGWREARLCLGRAADGVEVIFRATLGSVDKTGDLLLDVAIRAGMGTHTFVHCVGDGAVWIYEQVSRVFGKHARYLVDFFHVCEYLAAAAEKCTDSEPVKWISEQKEQLRAGQVSKVIEELEKNLEPPAVPNENAPVRACHRYLTNRRDQLDYPGARNKGLPIGSGEIESAHRYVVQQRMKLAGGWWKEENAEYMLWLLSIRASGEWQSYWDTYDAMTQNEAA